MTWLMATAASSHRHPLHVPVPPSCCSSSAGLCFAAWVCPNPASTSGPSRRASSCPPAFVAGGVRRSGGGTAAASGWIVRASAPNPWLCLRVVAASRKSGWIPLSREPERDGCRRCWRKRVAGSVRCGGAGAGAHVGVKHVEEVESEDDASILALEAEIYDFMQQSEKPGDFPTKEELIAAGRMDLVEAIVAHGGWFAYGWDFDDDEVSGSGDDSDDEEKEVDGADLGAHATDSPLPETNSSCSTTVKHDEVDARWMHEGILREPKFSGNTDSVSSSSAASSSGRPIDIKNREESGIEGILCRLEKERSFTYKDKEVESRILSNNKDYDLGSAAGGMARGSRSISLDSKKEFFPDFDGAVEIFPNGYVNQVENFLNDIPMDHCDYPLAQSVTDMRNGRKEPSFTVRTDQTQIQSRLQYLESGLASVLDSLRSRTDAGLSDKIQLRLQYLESELASVLDSLRSRTDVVLSDKGQESSLKKLHRLSDAYEYQETEIMNARDKLRSTRAKLAVLEGKMALEIIEAQKIVEEKQNRIDAAQKALSLLRTACVVWPNSASEVLLAGSFDGWSSQRRMERSSTGIFSLSLKLYPGQYEIKFIVDGAWKVDPLRPIVYNSGFENNLLVIS